MFSIYVQMCCRLAWGPDNDHVLLMEGCESSPFRAHLLHLSGSHVRTYDYPGFAIGDPETQYYGVCDACFCGPCLVVCGSGGPNLSRFGVAMYGTNSGTLIRMVGRIGEDLVSPRAIVAIPDTDRFVLLDEQMHFGSRPSDSILKMYNLSGEMCIPAPLHILLCDHHHDDCTSYST